MSHFVGLCFGENWEYNLDTYDENREVDEYIKFTKEEAIDDVKVTHAYYYEQAVEYLKDPNIKSELAEHYQKVVNKGLFISYEDAWKEAQEWGYKLDEEENLISTYNPDSKWDWYSIGGRWDGFLVLKERDENGDIVRTNQATFEEIDWDYMFADKNVPFCFIDECGDWYEKGSMGWWGIVSDEKDPKDWTEQFEDFVKTIDYDCLVTVVDFHI